MKIKLNNLQQENQAVKRVCLEKFSTLADEPDFVLGKEVAKFEKKFAAFCGVTYCVGVNSGTDALRTAILACGIKPGDEIITTPVSYTSTSLAIAHCGAVPVFADIKNDGNINPDKIEKLITVKTKAILPVHMYGNICEMSKLKAIAKKRKLMLIDDCSHAQGASLNGKRAGSLADISCFSFYPTKNLGAWGDAGALTTNNPMLFRRAILFKDYGESKRNYSKVIGYNSKLDTIQAIVLNEKLRYLLKWNRKKAQVACYYADRLRGLKGVELVPLGIGCSYYVFPVKTGKRERLIDFLSKKGIQTGIHYPVPIHLQECFKHLRYKKGDLPVAEKHAREILSLPFGAFISCKEQDKVIETIKDFLNNYDKDCKNQT